MHNEVTIRRADNGYVMTVFSTEAYVSSKISQEKIRYTIHEDVESVICTAEKALNIFEKMLTQDQK